jgi:hypothetical protein
MPCDEALAELAALLSSHRQQFDPQLVESSRLSAG